MEISTLLFTQQLNYKTLTVELNSVVDVPHIAVVLLTLALTALASNQWHAHILQSTILLLINMGLLLGFMLQEHSLTLDVALIQTCRLALSQSNNKMTPPVYITNDKLPFHLHHLLVLLRMTSAWRHKELQVLEPSSD